MRHEMTDAERILWSQLRNKQLNNRQFYRQRVFGNYIVDFYCPSCNLIIEVDGSHHLEPGQKAYDIKRTAYLQSLRLRVFRVQNHDVFTNIEGVISAILDFMEA